MKKQLKAIGIVLAMILAIMQFSTISYGTSSAPGGLVGPSIGIDITPPNIVSVSSDKTMLKPGETITFNMEVEDDMSGAQIFFVQWICKQDPTQTLHRQYDITSDIASYKCELSQAMMAGDWEARQVGIHDNQGNPQIYQRETSEIVAKFDFSVEDIGQDIKPPVVSNVKRITDTVTAPGEVIIQFDVTDNKSGVNSAGFAYSPANNLSHQAQEPGIKIGENTYQAKVKVETQYDKFVFQHIFVIDKAGNSAMYRYSDLGLTNNELDITPTNYVEDNTPPKLLSVEYNATELYLPDYLEITLKVEEKESGLDVFLGDGLIQSEDESFSKQVAIYQKIDNEGMPIANMGEIRLDLTDGETFRGKIYLSEIELRDKYGNKKLYSVENAGLEKQYIEIKKIEKTYSLTTRTTKTGYIDEIANLPEGSTVLCDVLKNNPIIEKELFDAIKGKDITVTFMSLYNGSGQMTSTSGEIGSDESNMGIQWIINGKDIVNETKDIDMVIRIAEKQYSKYIIPEYKLNEKLEEEFWENVDPDTTTDEQHEQKIQELIQLQKQELTRYFNSLKEAGYIGIDEVCAKAIERIENLYAMTCTDAIIMASEHIDYVSLEFAENGLLPGKTLIRVKPHFALRALIGVDDLKVYYVEDGKYTLIQENIDIDLEKYYNFTITHNSEYVLSNGAFDKLAKVENNVPGGDSNLGETDQDNTNQDNTNQGNTNQDNTNQGNTNQDNANKDETNKDDSNKDDASKDETNKDDANKDDANKDDASKDETNKDDANKDETNKDETNKNETSKDETNKDNTTNNNNKLDKTPNTGNIEIIGVISLIAVISLAGIIVLKKK